MSTILYLIEMVELLLTNQFFLENESKNPMKSHAIYIPQKSDGRDDNNDGFSWKNFETNIQSLLDIDVAFA